MVEMALRQKSADVQLLVILPSLGVQLEADEIGPPQIGYRRLVPTTALASNLVPVADELVARYHDVRDSGYIYTLVERIAQRFDDAPVRDYVPVLVANICGNHLRDLRAA